MYRARRIVLFFVATIIIGEVGVFAGGGPEGPDIDVAFFYMEICSSCETYQLAESLAGLLSDASKKFRNVKAKSYNVATPQHANVLREMIEDRGLPDISHLATVLIVNNKYIIGYEEIEAAVREIHDTGDLSLLYISEE